MKKILFLSFILIIVFAFIIPKFPLESSSKNVSAFKTVTKTLDYKYYELINDSQNLEDYTYYNSKLYYLIKSNQTYELYTFNLLNEQKQLIEKISNMDYCNLSSNLINCYSNTYAYIYDLNLNLLTKIDNSQGESKIIPYKDTYLKLTNNNLYLNHKYRHKYYYNN